MTVLSVNPMWGLMVEPIGCAERGDAGYTGREESKIFDLSY